MTVLNSMQIAQEGLNWWQSGWIHVKSKALLSKNKVKSKAVSKHQMQVWNFCGKLVELMVTNLTIQLGLDSCFLRLKSGDAQASTGWNFQNCMSSQSPEQIIERRNTCQF